MSGETAAGPIPLTRAEEGEEEAEADESIRDSEDEERSRKRDNEHKLDETQVPSSTEDAKKPESFNLKVPEDSIVRNNVQNLDSILLGEERLFRVVFLVYIDKL